MRPVCACSDSHAYSDGGSYQVVVSVADDDGGSSRCCLKSLTPDGGADGDRGVRISGTDWDGDGADEIGLRRGGRRFGALRGGRRRRRLGGSGDNGQSAQVLVKFRVIA